MPFRLLEDEPHNFLQGILFVLMLIIILAGIFGKSIFGQSSAYRKSAFNA